MSKHWPRVKLGEVLIEQKQRIGVFDADNLPLRNDAEIAQCPSVEFKDNPFAG
jgi:hypothetical protein